MSNIDTEFVMELFLDDNISTMNRIVVATANVINENLSNISFINDTLIKEHSLMIPSVSRTSAVKKPALRYGNYYEEKIKNFTDDDYYEKFKMSKATIEALIEILRDCVQPDCSIIPLDKKVYVFMWLLVNNSSFKEIGELFGLHKSSVCYIFHEIATLIAEQKNQFINWPSLEEQHMTRVKVNSKYGFPNCIGFIDALRLRVGSKSKKREKPEIILLQAVCDETLMFIDIHVGEIGVTQRNKVFRESNLFRELKNLIHFDNHILGDTDYKLRKNLITPFVSDDVVTGEEMRFNALLWKTHSYIREAFDILKHRFKRLSLIDMSKPEAVNTLICAACVLHNFILLREGSPVKEEEILNDEVIAIDPEIVCTAVEKRQFLCNYISFIQKSNVFC